ncbi:trimeric intracellular cation channel family protein [soil metagenome]
MDLSFPIILLDLLGAFVFALSGALMGEKKRMDIFGMLVLALVTSIGGGTLRSLLIGDTPAAFLTDSRYLLLAIFATLLVYFLKEQIYRFSSLIKIFDALGLGIFFSSGMTISLQQHFGFIPSILLGVITASFGGVIRDVLSAEIPLLFRKELYATVCIVGGMWYFLLYLFPIQREYIIVSTALVVAVLRIVAIQRNWSLPRVNNH